MEYGNFLLYAAPKLFLCGVAVILIIIACIFRKKHYDGPDYRDS